MRKTSVYDYFLSPIFTEKSSLLGEQNKYVFKVSDRANKTELKKAFEVVFGVKAESVSLLNTKGKTKTFRGRKGVRAGFKKAIITIPADAKIDLMSGV